MLSYNLCLVILNFFLFPSSFFSFLPVSSSSSPSSSFLSSFVFFFFSVSPSHALRFVLPTFLLSFELPFHLLFLTMTLHLNHFDGVSLLPIQFDGVTLLPRLFLLPWSLQIPLLSFQRPATLRRRCPHPSLLLLFRILHARLICLLRGNSSPFVVGSHTMFLLRSLTRFCLSLSLSLPFPTPLSARFRGHSPTASASIVGCLAYWP